MATMHWSPLHQELTYYIVILAVIGTIGLSVCNAQMTVDAGAYCLAGPPGSPGLNGRDGRDGRDGMSVIGEKGETGEKGSPGPQGEQGSCECPPATVKQCVWPNLDDGKDYGVIAECSFNKTFNNTSLRVLWNGDLRVYGDTDNVNCNRWYFTFNTEECEHPAKIDAIIVGTTNDQNQHRPAQIEGICSDIPAGLVTVGFHVGVCRVGDLGDAHTGWLSAVRIIIEELSLQP